MGKIIVDKIDPNTPGGSVSVNTSATFAGGVTVTGDITMSSSSNKISHVRNSPDNIGLHPNNPAPSAAHLYDNGFVTSGKGFYWITTANGGTKHVFCDFDTQCRSGTDSGKSGWMLVATFGDATTWTHGGFTTTHPIGPNHTNIFNMDGVRANYISSNFGDDKIKYWRIAVNNSTIFTTPYYARSLSHGSGYSTGADGGEQADWYYYREQATEWKRWWAPATGQCRYVHGMSQTSSTSNSGTTAGHQDTMSHVQGDTYNLINHAGDSHDKQTNIRFTHAYNLKWNYETTQFFTSLSDHLSSSAVNTTKDADYWTALTDQRDHTDRTATCFFSVFYQNSTSDGTLAILPQTASKKHANQNAVGQDMSGYNTSYGYDDTGRTAYSAYSASGYSDTAPNGQYNSSRNGTMYWWVR